MLIIEYVSWTFGIEPKIAITTQVLGCVTHCLILGDMIFLHKIDYPSIDGFGKQAFARGVVVAPAKRNIYLGPEYKQHSIFRSFVHPTPLRQTLCF